MAAHTGLRDTAMHFRLQLFRSPFNCSKETVCTSFASVGHLRYIYSTRCSVSAVKTTRSLPELNFGDMYMYLVEYSSPYTAAREKAYKSTESSMYFRSGWVINAAVYWRSLYYYYYYCICSLHITIKVHQSKHKLVFTQVSNFQIITFWVYLQLCSIPTPQLTLIN